MLSGPILSYRSHRPTPRNKARPMEVPGPTRHGHHQLRSTEWGTAGLLSLTKQLPGPDTLPGPAVVVHQASIKGRAYSWAGCLGSEPLSWPILSCSTDCKQPWSAPDFCTLLGGF